MSGDRKQTGQRPQGSCGTKTNSNGPDRPRKDLQTRKRLEIFPEKRGAGEGSCGTKTNSNEPDRPPERFTDAKAAGNFSREKGAGEGSCGTKLGEEQ